MIHQGDKSGPVIADATQCLLTSGATDIQLFVGTGKHVIQFQHRHHYLPFFHGKSFFEWEGKKYHWKGHTALIEDDTGILIAALHTRFLDDPQRLGTLVITYDGLERNMADLVVVTCLVMQERSEEGRLSVHFPLKK